MYKYALSSSQDEANLIAQMLLEERIYGNHPYRESAIIVRSSADVARIRRVLSSNGIPSRTSAALVPVRDEPAVRPFLDALQPARLRPQARREGTQPRRTHARRRRCRRYGGGRARRLRNPQCNRS